MSRPVPTAALLLGLLCLAVPSAAQERFPPPEFESGYTMPPTRSPAAAAPWHEIVDLGVLAVALAAASVLALRVRYRWPIVALSVFSLLYFGFYRGGCVCPIGAIQNVAQGLAGGTVLPLVVVLIFVLPLATALFFGRTLLGLLSKVSRYRVTITPTECVQCRLCEDACPFGAIRRPTAEAADRQRTRGKAPLAVMLALLPALVVAGGFFGGLLGPTMARLHPTVALADRIRLENAGEVDGTTEASEAFRATGRTADDLYADAGGIESTFTALWRPGGLGVGAAHLLGAFVGLVIALKLAGLGLRRRRRDYEADRASCVACGRCFAHCPIERAARKGTEVTITPAEA